MRNQFLAVILFNSLLMADAQPLLDSVMTLPDTAKPFTLEMLYEEILRHHPVAKQASLLSDMAKQELRLARGSFDPKLGAQYAGKRYDGKEYYSLFDATLKMPTKSPLTPVIAYDRSSGPYVNPQDYISNESSYSQMSVGLSIPLGRGLLTDERRTTLKQAQLFQGMMEAEKVKLINKLLLEAAKDYWQWYASFYSYRLAVNTAVIAEEIMRRTKLHLQNGEVAAIDTIQAQILLVERQVKRQESHTEWKNNTLKISTYLWDSLTNPAELAPSHVPVGKPELVVLSDTTLEELINQAKSNHPEIQKLDMKLRHLEFDRQLAREMMKPALDVTYYKLGQPFAFRGGDAFTFTDNHKVGLDFSFPLFLRKERAKLAQTKLKLSSARFDREQTSRQIINEITTAYNQLVNYARILQQQRAMVELYSKLVNAELINLENGESDLFKINIQQGKLFEAQSKLIKVTSEYAKQKAYLYWSAGATPFRIRAIP